MTLERLRRALADLQSRQRETGGAATDFFTRPYAAQRAQQTPPASCFGSPATLRWGGGWATVQGELARTVAFGAAIAVPTEMATERLAESDVFESVAQLGRLQQAREVALVRLVTELETRGVDCPGGLSRIDWLRSLDATLTGAQARAITTVAVAFTQPRWQALHEAVTRTGDRAAAEDHTAPDNTAEADQSAEGDNTAEGDVTVGGVMESRVTVGRVTVGKAAAVVDFHDRLAKVADPAELEQAVDHLTAQAGVLGPEELARLARQLSEQVRPPRDRDEHDQACRQSRGLWWGLPNSSGMVGLRAVLDPEGAAVIKSALDPLSAPRPLTEPDIVDPDGTVHRGKLVEPDHRPAHQRRADALIEIIARGVSSPGAAPATDKARINVTIDYDALADVLRDSDWFRATGQRDTTDTNANATTATGTTGATGATGMRDTQRADGEAMGTRASPGVGRGRGAGGVCLSGDVLSAATVRRFACDAGIIPVVLGSLGQPLDVGREERLVTRAMRALLWLRDRGCSFPGCSMPAQWTDAHHVRHWIHGGPTSVANLALLCRRHHTYVHDKNLTATVTDTGVTWHTWQAWRLHPDPEPDDPVATDPSATAPDRGS